MKHGGLKSFFPLMEQHTTQAEPAFCGISTLVVVLNAFAVDPRRTWKGPWRWYDESMLNCCVDLEQIKKSGITLSVFDCLATCQGLSTSIHYVDHSDSTLDDFRRAVERTCVERKCCSKKESVGENVKDLLVVSYNRKVVGQTGSGHFSPLAAYDKESDSVLILDTARFKYGAHWIKLPLVYEAMQPQDPDSGRSRGYVILSMEEDGTSPGLPSSLLLQSRMAQNHYRQEYKQFLNSLNHEITWEEVVKFWTEDGSEPKHIFQAAHPRVRPRENDHEEIDKIAQVRDLIAKLIPTESGITFPEVSSCGVNRGRSIDLKPAEGIFIMYLASMDKSHRTAIIFNEVVSASDFARQQLLAEADLVQYAIEISDNETVQRYSVSKESKCSHCSN